MPRKIALTDTQLQWLRDNKDKTPKELAQEIGCCIDTLKRILTREGIRHFDAAKYVPLDRPDLWERPCLVCRSIEPRPRWQYVCDACKARAESIL